MTTYAWQDPGWLALLLLWPAAWWWRRRRAATVWVVPFAAHWAKPAGRAALPWETAAAVAGGVLLTVALARPQRVTEARHETVRGHDVMLVLDVSTSMLTCDYRRGAEGISRFEAVRPIVRAFVERRADDRVGLVVFAGRAYTVAPLTTDHGWLLRQLERVRPGMIEDGTALGDGVMVALERLGTGGAEGSGGGRRLGACVVLLTDGVENAGLFSPKEARERAVERGVPVFAIAAGRNGKVRVPFRDGEGKWRVREELAEVDEDTLHLMALATGGKFFRGPDARTVAGAFGAIADLRPTERTMRVTRRRTELFPWLAGPGAVLLAAAAWGLARRRGVEERGK